MKVHDLFPLCQSEECPDRGKHKHLLPHQQLLLDSDAKYVCLTGGFGSAKTLPACVLCVLLMLSVPGNVGFVGRRTYSKLHDSTLRIFMEVLERLGGDFKTYENRDGFPHRVVLPNDSEVVFRETKDLGRWLGSEYGFFYLDEAAEEPESSFTGLMGRLRLPRAGPYLKGILTTNPPHDRHWIAKRFGTKAGDTYTRVTVDGKDISTKYTLYKSSTRDNPHLPDGYVADLLTLNPLDVQRVVEGNFGIQLEGPPAYPQFTYSAHVGEPGVRAVPLIRGWDFGFRHPAVTWHQYWRCDKDQVHWSLLDELDGESIEIEDFAKKVFEHTTSRFGGVSRSMVLDAGDHQGIARSDKGPGAIIQLAAKYRVRFRHRKITDIDPGLDLIRSRLVAKCPCGVPIVSVHRRCKSVINGFAGGYHYPKTRKLTGPDKPVKDEFYDDFMDSIRYACDNYLRIELVDRNLLAKLSEEPIPTQTSLPAGWDWMERPIQEEDVTHANDRPAED